MEKILGNANLGENIRQLRLSCGLTQEQTVARLQVLGSPISRSTYSLIEMGRGNIYTSDLVGLKTVFNASYDDFFTGIDPSRKQNGTGGNSEEMPEQNAIG